MPERPSPTRQESSAGWLRGIRFSGFSIIMMGLVVLAVIVLAPSLRVFAEQRSQILGLESEVAAQRAQLDELQAERERWNDTTFIQTQARERLYFVRPGEVSYLVINDVPELAAEAEVAPVSTEVEKTRPDWMRTLLASVVVAGLAPAAGEGTP